MSYRSKLKVKGHRVNVIKVTRSKVKVIRSKNGNFYIAWCVECQLSVKAQCQQHYYNVAIRSASIVHDSMKYDHALAHNHILWSGACAKYTIDILCSRAWSHIVIGSVRESACIVISYYMVILPLYQNAPPNFGGAFWLRSFCPSKSGDPADNAPPLSHMFNSKQGHFAPLQVSSWVILPLRLEGQNDSTSGGAFWKRGKMTGNHGQHEQKNCPQY